MTFRTRADFISLTAVLIAAVFSGLASLSYQVVWSRMLVIPLGNSADATAMVLSSFMLGIAVGAVLLGKAADHTKSPLKLYAVLEAIMGILAFIVPVLISKINDIEFLRGGFSDNPVAAVGRMFYAGIIVFIPSLVMGATIPVLIKALSHASSDIKKRIGPVYGMNTIGAALGASVTGFFAIPSFGFYTTSTIAAACNFSAAAIVLLAQKGFLSGPKAELTQSNDEEIFPPRRIAAIALIAVGVSGATMLSAEVLWARVLTFVFGHDTYAFAALLAIVLLGLGIGGVIYRYLVKFNPIVVCTVLLGLLAVSLLASYWSATVIVTSLGRDPFHLSAIAGFAASLRLEFYREILYTPILVLLPSIVSGILFPASCALFAGPVSEAGKRIGIATLVNGIGCALGSLATSFILIGLFGIQTTLIIAALAVAGTSLAAAVVYASQGQKRVAIASLTPALIAAVISVVMPASLSRTLLEEAVGSKHQDILFYEEGRTGTVSVTRNKINNEKQLFMNAVNEVTTRLVHDQSFKLLGHLGPLLHPDPKKGAMVCLGAGLSAGAALVHPLATLDVVELSSTIPKAAELWADENNRVLEDPRFHLHIADGRHFLLSTEKQFDVIMVDSTHPKAVDSWILYTKEFYGLLKKRLKEHGIAVQWLPLHGLSEREFKIIVRTFFEVFPETTLWVNVGFEEYGQAAYLKLVASDRPLEIDYSEFAMRLREPQIAKDLEPFGMDVPEEILDSYLAGPRAVNAWTLGLPVQTDNRPIVPYTTQYSTGRRMTAPLLLSVRSPVINALYNIGENEKELREKLVKAEEAQGFLLAGMLDRAAETWPDGKKIALFQQEAAKGRDYYLSLAKKYEKDTKKMFEIGSLLGNLGYSTDAAELYKRAHKDSPDNPEYAVNLALAVLDQGNTDEAERLLKEVLKKTPKHPLANYNLGVVLNRAGRFGEALPYLEISVSLLPNIPGAKSAMAESLLELGRLNKAESVLLEIVESNAFIAEAWDMLGLIAGRRKDWEGAKEHHLRALSVEPYRAASHYNLGIALEELGRIKEAAGAYQAALRIEPKDAEALNNLGLVYARAGLFDQAAEFHRKALDLEPHFPEAAYNLGLAYLALKQHFPAAEAFGIAVDLNPELEDAQKQLNALKDLLKSAADTDTNSHDTDSTDNPTDSNN